MIDALNHVNLGTAYLLVIAASAIGAGIAALLVRRRR